MRDTAAAAAQTFERAGIRLLLITGDHPATAAAVGQQLGIWRDGDGVAHGDGARLDPDSSAGVRVFARIQPEQKLDIIATAIHEGRRIYDNIRRFLRYALAGGVAEILVMLLGPLAGLAVPLLPAQILWINLLTHGVPGVALGAEPAEPDTTGHRALPSSPSSAAGWPVPCWAPPPSSPP